MSSSSAAERSSTTPELRDFRGRQVLLVFSNQGVGNLVSDVWTHTHTHSTVTGSLIPCSHSSTRLGAHTDTHTHTHRCARGRQPVVHSSSVCVCVCVCVCAQVNSAVIVIAMALFGQTGYQDTLTYTGSRNVLVLVYGIGALICVVMVVYRVFFLEESTVRAECDSDACDCVVDTDKSCSLHCLTHEHLCTWLAWRSHSCGEQLTGNKVDAAPLRPLVQMANTR